MMDKRPKKELIDGIKDFLRDFEEPYDREEWAHFQRQRQNKPRKPIPLFVKLAGIAASLFLMVYASVRILPLFDRIDEASKKVRKEMPYLSKEKKQQTSDTLAMDSIEPLVGQNNQKHQSESEKLVPVTRLPYLTPSEEVEIPKVTTPAGNTGLTSDSTTIAPTVKKAPLQIVPLDGVLGGNRKPPHRKPDKSIRMNFSGIQPLVGSRVGLSDTKIGFNLTPAFTDKGFSLGGGISARIPLSSRISTEIGVNYSNLRVGIDMEADRADTVNLQTIGIRNSVGTVAIPVSLNYSLTENFSASLGLVPFRVVSDRRTDIYQSYRWVRGDVSSGDTTRRLIGEQTRSQRADSVYMGNTYLGFIQLSGQLSPPFLKKHHAVIAPFVAIPVGRLRDDEYRWLHGGVSFRIYLR